MMKELRENRNEFATVLPEVGGPGTAWHALNALSKSRGRPSFNEIMQLLAEAYGVSKPYSEGSGGFYKSDVYMGNREGGKWLEREQRQAEEVKAQKHGEIMQRVANETPEGFSLIMSLVAKSDANPMQKRAFFAEAAGSMSGNYMQAQEASAKYEQRLQGIVDSALKRCKDGRIARAMDARESRMPDTKGWQLMSAFLESGGTGLELFNPAEAATLAQFFRFTAEAGRQVREMEREFGGMDMYEKAVAARAIAEYYFPYKAGMTFISQCMRAGRSDCDTGARISAYIMLEAGVPENQISIMASLFKMPRHAYVRLGDVYFDATPNLKREYAGSGAEHFFGIESFAEDEAKYGKFMSLSLRGDALITATAKSAFSKVGLDKLMEIGIRLMPD